MMHIAVLLILAAVSVFGTVGNICIIGAVCLYRRLRMWGNAFIVNLAVADLIIVAYIMPIGLVTSQFEENPFNDTMCQVNAFLILTSCGVSTQTLMMIAIERYFHICQTGLYQKIFTPRWTIVFIVIIWAYTIAWTCQGFTGWTQFVYGSRTYLCTFRGSLSYGICLSIFGMIIPMVVLAVCYSLIFRTVKRSKAAIYAHKKKAEKESPENQSKQRLMSSQERNVNKEYRLLCTLVTIVVFFVIFWTPAALVLTFSRVWSMPPLIYPIAVWMALCNSSVNGIIYGVMNKNFRKGYYELLKHIICCKITGRQCYCRCSHPSMNQSLSTSETPMPSSPDTYVTGIGPRRRTNSGGSSIISYKMKKAREREWNKKMHNLDSSTTLDTTPANSRPVSRALELETKDDSELNRVNRPVEIGDEKNIEEDEEKQPITGGVNGVPILTYHGNGVTSVKYAGLRETKI